MKVHNEQTAVQRKEIKKFPKQIYSCTYTYLKSENVCEIQVTNTSIKGWDSGCSGFNCKPLLTRHHQLTHFDEWRAVRG